MSDLNRYNDWQDTRSKQWESLCTRCGACCGALDDPCENLRETGGRYYCAVYERRFGTWKTVSGQEINCVPIREKLGRGESWPGDERCGYKVKSETWNA